MKTSMLSLALVFAAGTSLPVSAQLQAPARPAPQRDLRVRNIAYQPDSVTTVSSRPDFETMINFAPGERIENVAVGDSTSWQVVPNKNSNLLFVKPASLGAHTNMAVVTDQRAYLFELRSDDAAGPVMYSVRFTYPEGALPKPAAVVPKIVTTPWQANGTPSLRPARAYDDGHSVFVSWPKDVDVPAMLAVDDKGIEEPLTFTAHDNYLVTEAVPSKILIRVGRKQAVLVPDPARSAPEQLAGR